MNLSLPSFQVDFTEVKVVFFDAAGTLIHLPRGVAYHYAEVARRHGADIPETDIQRAFQAAWEEMPPRLPTHGPRPEDDKGWWRALVERTLDRLPATLDRAAYFEDLYAEFTLPGVWALFPEVSEVLEVLAGRSQLGVISNFDGRLRLILEQLGISGSFRELVLSSEVGADKPHRAIFETALARFGAAPREALHVGDDPERDWQAAARLGIRVFPLERPAMDLYPLIRER
jgi:putative hydrolase of the HAD superfamily